jgi:hypothetical protein
MLTPFFSGSIPRLATISAIQDETFVSQPALFPQEDVFEYGHVSQTQVIAGKETASIQYYACTCPEIAWISIRELAVAGCAPMTTDFAVFEEKEYCVLGGRRS